MELEIEKLRDEVNKIMMGKCKIHRTITLGHVIFANCIFKRDGCSPSFHCTILWILKILELSLKSMISLMLLLRTVHSHEDKPIYYILRNCLFCLGIWLVFGDASGRHI